MRNTFKKFMPLTIFALVLVFAFTKPSFAYENFADFSLSDDGEVKASYDDSEKLLTITGSGKISYNKWAIMSHKFNSKYFAPSNSYPISGWGSSKDANFEAFDIEFKADPDKKIKLCNSGSFGGLFTFFGGNINFNKCVDVSEVTDMNNMFRGAKKFNGDISDWDVSNVTDMSLMFFDAVTFNGDISNWDVSSVTNMLATFSTAKKFNGDISNWDVSNVTNMSAMFNWTEKFNQDISSWDTSNVEDMSHMFARSLAFNGDISTWDVSKVKNFSCFLRYNDIFDVDLSDWDVSNVTNMGSMFEGASNETFDISKWDTSKVVSFSYAFKDSNFKNINLLNRESYDTYAYASNMIYNTELDFIGFAKLREFTWENMPYDYWISEDGAPFVKENTKGATKTFKEDTKYILTRQINSHLEIGDYEGKYTGRAITIDDISHNSKDILGNDIDGTWSLDLNGYNGIDSGTHTVLVTFTPNDTDKYRTVTKEVEITMPKSENEGEEVIGNGNGTGTGTTGSSTGNGTTIADSETPQAGTGLPFGDVKETDWFYAGVKESFDKGVLLGTSDDKFTPYMDVTRGMMVTVLYRINNEPIEKIIDTYPDVVKDAYYEKAVSWGTTNKVVKGYGTEYKPEKHITRQEMIAMLYRYYNSKKKDTASADVKSLEAFTDRSEVLDYAVNPMAWAVSNKLIVGRTKDTLAPKGELTRAELAVILQRFAKMMK